MGTPHVYKQESMLSTIESHPWSACGELKALNHTEVDVSYWLRTLLKKDLIDKTEESPPRYALKGTPKPNKKLLATKKRARQNTIKPNKAPIGDDCSLMLRYMSIPLSVST